MILKIFNDFWTLFITFILTFSNSKMNDINSQQAINVADYETVEDLGLFADVGGNSLKYFDIL